MGLPGLRLAACVASSTSLQGTCMCRLLWRACLRRAHPAAHAATAPPACPAAARARRHGIRHLRLSCVRGDPRSRRDMQQLVDVTQYKAAIVLCGAAPPGAPHAAAACSAGALECGLPLAPRRLTPPPACCRLITSVVSCADLGWGDELAPIEADGGLASFSQAGRCACACCGCACSVIAPWQGIAPPPRRTVEAPVCPAPMPAQADMLRFDALVLMVQLNIRRILEARSVFLLLPCTPLKSGWLGKLATCLCGALPAPGAGPRPPGHHHPDREKYLRG